MVLSEELLEHKWILPAAASLVLLLIVIVRLWLAKAGRRRRGKGSDGANNLDNAAGGTVFVEEDGHLVRRSQRVRKSMPGSGEYATPVKAPRKQETPTTPVTRASARKAAEPPKPEPVPSPPDSPIAAVRGRRRMKA